MTKEWYQQNGYGVSVNIDQAVIDRAEKDALAAYVKPILPAATGTEESIKPLLADIAFAIVLQRSLKVTRKGTKIKTDAQSTSEGLDAALREQATSAKLAICRLRELPGASANAQVNDISRFYFRTQLLGG